MIDWRAVVEGVDGNAIDFPNGSTNTNYSFRISVRAVGLRLPWNILGSVWLPKGEPRGKPERT